MYGRIFSTTFTGSMVGAGSVVFAVWAYVLAHVDREGELELNPRLLAGILGDTPENVKSAITFLSSEDPESRSEAEGGRRLVQTGAFTYQVVNYLEYAALRSSEELREYARRKKAEYRARQKARELGLPDPPTANVLGQSVDMSSSIKIVDLDSREESKNNLESNPPLSSNGKPDPDLGRNTAIVFEYWQTVMDKPKATLTALRKQRIHGILKSKLPSGMPKYTVQDVISAINGCKKSPHHMGDNDRHTMYNDIELICREETKFERFIELNEKKTNAPAQFRNSNGRGPGSGAVIANRPYRTGNGAGQG